MAHYVDTHPDFTDCFVLRSATTGEWQYVGDEDYVIEMVDGWGDVVTEAIGYTTRELAEQAAAKHSVFAPKPIPGDDDDDDDLREWEARDRFNREDHYAHVLAGWEHHHAYAHLEPSIELPF